MTPAGWIRYYYDRKESIGAPALNIIDSEGRIYDSRCSKCKGKARHQKDEGYWVCGHCGEVWEFHDVVIFKGKRAKTPPRPHGFDRQLGRMFDIGRLISRFLADPDYRWDARLYIGQVACGYSQRELAKQAHIFFPDIPGGLSKTSVQRRLTRASLRWSAIVKTAGL